MRAGFFVVIDRAEIMALRSARDFVRLAHLKMVAIIASA
jgi:hypothetical protein